MFKARIITMYCEVKGNKKRQKGEAYSLCNKVLKLYMKWYNVI